MRVEVIVALDMVLRAKKMLRAMIEAAAVAGVEVVETRQWERQAPILMTYGLGHPLRRQWQEEHKAAGGRLIGWDLGYYLRDIPRSFSMRCTLDDDHPERWIRPEPGDRWERAKIKLREDADPSGPIILVGMGRKSCVHLGMDPGQWESRKLRELQQRFPDRRIVYRPKRETDRLEGAQAILGPIEKVLQGASLVVCRHSNVAVDACIAGVPVECSNGAAFALYRNGAEPSREERLSFMQSLAYWNWNPLEAAAAWQYLRSRIEE